jgi:hypothetical protein
LGVSPRVIARATGSLFVAELVYTVFAFAVCYALAALSWRLVESRALRWKELVPYGATAVTTLEVYEH